MNLKNKQYIVLLHGFKKHGENVFDYFLDELEKYEHNFEIIRFDYYDNLDKSTLKASKYISKINQELDKLELNSEIYIVGYSMGGVASLSLLSRRENVKKVVALSPAFKISFWDFPIKLFKNLQKKRKIQKKLGKKRYKSLKKEHDKGISEKYPFRVTIQINFMRLKMRKKVKFLKNKDLYLLFSKNDTINKLDKTLIYLSKHLDFSKNNSKIEFVEASHFEMIDKNNSETIQKIFTFFELK